VIEQICIDNYHFEVVPPINGYNPFNFDQFSATALQSNLQELDGEAVASQLKLHIAELFIA
jgi:hypothetical protein